MALDSKENGDAENLPSESMATRANISRKKAGKAVTQGATASGLFGIHTTFPYSQSPPTCRHDQEN